MIEILSNGALNTVQDLGRQGWLASGVSIGGAMDGPALRVANRLVGNVVEATGLEIQVFPFRFRAVSATAVAVTGCDCEVTVDGVPMPGWWARPLSAGQTIALAVPRSGARAYVALAGGIDVPVVLGSKSTDLRGRFGGLDGRGLAKGDTLALGDGTGASTPILGAGWGAVLPERLGAGADALPLRVLRGAEYDRFDPVAQQSFTAAGWTVGAEANRMGYRLAGPVLSLLRPVELLSHGIMPGTVQVPPAGQPIIQLADANTCGGYPKIAAVIEADHWILAQASPGTTLRFVFVEEDEAVQPLRERNAWLDTLAAERVRLFGT